MEHSRRDTAKGVQFHGFMRNTVFHGGIQASPAGISSTSCFAYAGKPGLATLLARVLQQALNKEGNQKLAANRSVTGPRRGQGEVSKCVDGVPGAWTERWASRYIKAWTEGVCVCVRARACVCDVHCASAFERPR